MGQQSSKKAEWVKGGKGRREFRQKDAYKTANNIAYSKIHDS